MWTVSLFVKGNSILVRQTRWKGTSLAEHPESRG